MMKIDADEITSIEDIKPRKIYKQRYKKSWESIDIFKGKI